MTENEVLKSALAKVEAQQDNLGGFMDRFNIDEHWAVRKALEEIQQYRAIGTVEELPLLVSKGREYDQVAWERDIAIEQLEEIGISFGQKTDDVRTAVERIKPRKVVNKKGFIIAKDKGGNEFYEANPYCPSCNTPIDNGGTAKGVYCKWCGQRFDWSE